MAMITMKVWFFLSAMYFAARKVMMVKASDRTTTKVPMEERKTIGSKGISPLLTSFLISVATTEPTPKNIKAANKVVSNEITPLMINKIFSVSKLLSRMIVF